MLNDKQRVVSVTLQESHFKSHTTNDAYEINLMLGRIIVENKVEKTDILFLSLHNLFMHFHFDTNKAYSSHMHYGCIKLVTLGQRLRKLPPSYANVFYKFRRQK